MDCKLIFYNAYKTSFCERALLKSFADFNLSLTKTVFATNSQTLGDKLEKAFDKNTIVFILAKLNTDGRNSIESVLSRVMSCVKYDELRKIKNNFGNDGYVFKQGNQLLVILPDEPEQIEILMQGPLSNYIKITENVRV